MAAIIAARRGAQSRAAGALGGGSELLPSNNTLVGSSFDFASRLKSGASIERDNASMSFSRRKFPRKADIKKDFVLGVLVGRQVKYLLFHEGCNRQCKNLRS